MSKESISKTPGGIRSATSILTIVPSFNLTGSLCRQFCRQLSHSFVLVSKVWTSVNNWWPISQKFIFENGIGSQDNNQDTLKFLSNLLDSLLSNLTKTFPSPSFWPFEIQKLVPSGIAQLWPWKFWTRKG